VENDQAIAVAAAICRKFEGLYLKPYLCPANIPTIGYGTTMYENDIKVTLADPSITKERAEQLLAWELNQKLKQVVTRCPNLPELGPKATGAVLDFTYNLGVGAFGSSMLRRKLLAGDVENAKIELTKWVRGGGKVLPGLVKRRALEAALLG
jgi:lysozyme